MAHDADSLSAGKAEWQPIAVAVVHGVGRQDPTFADELIAELTYRFARFLPANVPDPQTQIIIEPVHWAPVLQHAEEQLWQRLKREGDLNFIKLRRFMVEFGADALAYQPLPHRRAVYDAIHGVMARSLRRLAERAGSHAPLCVIAHSLGSVIASNYIYDLQAEKMPDSVRAVHQPTPVELGETFAFFYTLGSPIALWSLRFSDFGMPINVPSPRLAHYYPALKGEWVNFYDPDDIIGYPLKPLNEKYRRVVKADIPVNVGSILASWNPLSHMGYWTDNDITVPIARALAEGWKQVNAARLTANT
ncbi:MAG: hypothetical protein D6784_09655 [Chloroflexi bacterium]|nr:MAG: hypothetical protein D6784_09655 [Chloroflexota bacterium]